MAKIKNIVFDLGGVFIDLDHDQAVRRFKEIGVEDAEQLLDPYVPYPLYPRARIR